MRNNQYFRALLAKANEPSKPLTEAEKEKRDVAVRDREQRKKERIKKKLERTKRWKARQDKLKTEKEAREQEASKYRDRAAEVQKGVNPDYQDDDEINFQEMDYEKSKYLGGDVAHTHMVKGLDYVLLNRRRHEIGEVDDKKLEEEYEKAKKKSDKAPEKPKRVQRKFNSKLARYVHRKFFKQEYDDEENHKLTKCQKFLPGRMVFEFDVFTDNAKYVPTPVHISNFDTVQGPNIFTHDVPPSLMMKMHSCFGRKGGRRRRKKRKRNQKVKKESRREKTPPCKKPEDDIYSDDGQDYQPSKTNEGEKKRKYFQDPEVHKPANTTKVEAANILGKVMAKANRQKAQKLSVKEDMERTEIMIERKKALLKKQNAVGMSVKDENSSWRRSVYARNYYDSSGDEAVDSDDITTTVDDESEKKKKKKNFKMTRRSRAKAQEAKLKREADKILGSYKRNDNL